MSNELESYLPEGTPIPTSDPDGLQKPFWDGLNDNSLQIQRCKQCETWVWAPEWICHHCHSTELEWTAVEPVGRIYSWNRVWYPVSPALAEACPYICVVVELSKAANVRVVGNLLGDRLQNVEIGRRVRGVFEHHQNAAVSGSSAVSAGYAGVSSGGDAGGSASYTLLQWQLDSDEQGDTGATQPAVSQNNLGK